VEREKGPDACFEISNIEQIKGIPRGKGKGMLGFFDTLKIPIIENTAGGTNISIGINITWSEVIITYIPCLRTSTAYASGYLFIAASKPLVRSSSKAVFSM
jgi:methylthioribulose-1-phosphate dehydratase